MQVIFFNIKMLNPFGKSTILGLSLQKTHRFFSNDRMGPIQQANQYNPRNHSQLNSINIIENNAIKQNTFIIQEKKKQSLLLLNPLISDQEHYKTIAEKYNNLISSVIFFNFQDNSSEFIDKIFSASFQEYITNDVEIISFDGISKHQIGHKSSIYEQHIRKAEDQKPIEFGDQCICYLSANGFDKQNCVIAITEVGEYSTKTPIQFTGDILTLGSVSNEIHDYEAAYDSLGMIRSFPNETILVPNNCRGVLENLKWTKKIDVNNYFVDMKMKLLKNQGKKVFNGQLFEEKKLNLYLKLEDKVLDEIFETDDVIVKFKKILAFEKMFYDGLLG